MIRKWEVFSKFSCSPEIISSLHTLRILIAFAWHLCTDLLGKHFPSLRDLCLDPANTVAEWLDLEKGNTHLYCAPSSTGLLPVNIPQGDVFCWFLSHPNPTLWGSSAVPAPLQCYWNCYLGGSTTLSRSQLSRALGTLLQWCVPVVWVASGQQEMGRDRDRSKAGHAGCCQTTTLTLPHSGKWSWLGFSWKCPQPHLLHQLLCAKIIQCSACQNEPVTITNFITLKITQFPNHIYLANNL